MKLQGQGVATVSAWVAHLLAWAIGIALLFAPTYGVSEAVAQPRDAPSGTPVTPETMSSSATLIEVNGVWVLLLLAIPVLLTGFGLAAAIYPRIPRALRLSILWCLAVGALIFCLMGLLSIGLLYLPVALALIVAATASLGAQRSSLSTGR